MNRRMLMVVSLFTLFVGIAVAAAEEKKENEAKEHADARKGLAKAKITMREAVEIALKKVPGGKAVEANLELEGDEVEYEVELVADGKDLEVEVDAMTGKAGDPEPEHDGGGPEEDKAEAAAAKAPVTLLNAIDAAIKAVPGGKPFEAESEMEHGKLIFEVELVSGDKIMEVEIDANTGNVVEVHEEKE